jgi:hypothetical protein
MDMDFRMTRIQTTSPIYTPSMSVSYRRVNRLDVQGSSPQRFGMLCVMNPWMDALAATVLKGIGGGFRVSDVWENPLARKVTAIREGIVAGVTFAAQGAIGLFLRASNRATPLARFVAFVSSYTLAEIASRSRLFNK